MSEANKTGTLETNTHVKAEQGWTVGCTNVSVMTQRGASMSIVPQSEVFAATWESRYATPAHYLAIPYNA